MAEFSYPFNIEAPGDTPEQAESKRQMLRWMAQEIKTRIEEVLRSEAMSNARTASGLRSMKNVVNLDKASRPAPGDVLYAIDGTHAAWGPIGGTGPTGGGPGGVGKHDILDGDVHLDSNVGSPDLGSLIAGDGTDWSQLSVGADGEVLTADSGDPLGVSWQPAAGGAEVELILIYGNGPDGSHTMDGATAVTGCFLSGSTYFATRDVYFDDLTINGGVTFVPDGFRVFVAGTLTNNGTISRAGNAGGNGTNATAGVSTGGTAGAAQTSFSVGGSAAGGTGRAGTTGAGTAGNAGGQAEGEGGDGGAGGAGEGNSVPSGTIPGGVATTEDVKRFRSIGTIMDIDFARLIQGGSGGRGGSSGTGNITKGGAGGGGGGGGAVIGLWARDIVNAGTISVAGGAGGNGGNTDGAAGAGGGGGGGGGGFLYVVYDTLTGAGTMTAAGGAGGNVGTQGTGGGAGSNGGNGAAGNLVRYSRLTGLFT